MTNGAPDKTRGNLRPRRSVGASPGLTPLQHDVLLVFARGIGRREVAAYFGLSDSWIDKILSSAYRALDAPGLVPAMHAMGWVTLPEEVRS